MAARSTRCRCRSTSAEDGLTHQLPDAGRAEAGCAAERSRRSEDRILPRMPDPVRRYYQRERPIELRPVEYGRYLGEKLEGGRYHMWIRATGRLPDEPAIHQCVLAYASDMTLLDAALIPHGQTYSTRTSWRRASTTRCGFIVRSAPTNGCSTRRTARISAARAASPGARSSPSDGTLVASVAQEGLLRQRRAQAGSS